MSFSNGCLTSLLALAFLEPFILIGLARKDTALDAWAQQRILAWLGQEI